MIQSLNFNNASPVNFTQTLIPPGLVGGEESLAQFGQNAGDVAGLSGGGGQLPNYRPSVNLQLAKSPDKMKAERIRARNMMYALQGQDDKIQCKPKPPCQKGDAHREAGDRLRAQYNKQVKAQAAQLSTQGFQVNFS